MKRPVLKRSVNDDQLSIRNDGQCMCFFVWSIKAAVAKNWNKQNLQSWFQFSKKLLRPYFLFFSFFFLRQHTFPFWVLFAPTSKVTLQNHEEKSIIITIAHHHKNLPTYQWNNLDSVNIAGSRNYHFSCKVFSETREERALSSN